MSLTLNALTKSIWVFHFASSACNNCDIEILDVLTPRFDVERFGIMLVGSIRHADAILVTGMLNRKGAVRLKQLYDSAPKPVVVIAFGSCASSQGIFKNSYNRVIPVDEVVPVSAYIPGCPPRPEAIIDGVVKLINKLKGR
jgi:Ni,Fe-hydrogenase III small subunit